MRSFAERSRERELMDDPDIPAEELIACLADLATVNTVTGARPPTLAWLAEACRPLKRGDAFSLIDVGYGQGDMLRAIHAWTLKAGLKARLIGVDLNPSSAVAARAATDARTPIEYWVGDVFDLAEPASVDFIISSLVAHHLTDAQLIAFIQMMERKARRGWFVNDLHRHAIAFYGFKALATLANWHPLVRHDGPISVARAFRIADWARLLGAAGVASQDVAIRWRFPFRICVSRIRSTA